MARATVITRQFCKAILRQHKGQRSNVQPGHCNALVHHFGELFICTYNGLSLSLSLLSPPFYFFPSLSIFLISGCNESPGAWVELMLYTVDPLTIVHWFPHFNLQVCPSRMLRQRMPVGQLFVAVVLGMATGAYIFRPYFQNRRLQQAVSVKTEKW